MKQAADLYHDAGLCCLPAMATEKRPLLPGWKQYQKQLPGDERNEWQLPRLCLICGKVSGGLECIDFDGGGALFGEWAAEVPGELFERLVIQQTPSGGYHAVYRCDEISGNEKLAMRGKACLIETRGEGGLFLAAPSAGYTMIQGDFASVQTISPEEREHLLAVARSLGESSQPTERRNECGEFIGERPGDMYNQSGDFLSVLHRHGWEIVGQSGDNLRLRRPGKTGRTWSATVKDRTFYCFTSSAPPFEPSTAYSPFAVLAMLDHGGDFSAAARSLEGPRVEAVGDDVDLSGILGDGDDGDDLPTIELERPELPPEIFGELLPPVMRDALDWMLDNEIKPQPEMSLGALVTLFGTTLGHQVQDDYGTRTNVMVVCLGPSSSGKDRPRKLIKRLLAESGQAELIGPERFASHAAIISLLAAGAVRLAMLDELGRMMATMSNVKSAHLHEIPTTLMQCYTSSDTVWMANSYGDAKSNKTINQPHLCVLGTSVPDSFFGALTTDQLQDGLLGRMMIFEGRGDVKRRTPRNTEIPQSVLNRIRWHRTLADGGNLNQLNPAPRMIDKTPEAAERHERHCQDVDERLSRDGRHAEAIWGRTPELAAKLALIHACCWGPAGDPPRIGIESVSWGRKLANYNARLMTYAAGGSIGDSDFEKLIVRTYRAIRESREMTQRALHRSAACRRLTVRELDQVLAKLQAMGTVEIVAGNRANQRLIRSTGKGI